MKPPVSGGGTKAVGRALDSNHPDTGTEETEWVSASVQSDGRWTYIHTNRWVSCSMREMGS